MLALGAALPTIVVPTTPTGAATHVTTNVTTGVTTPGGQRPNIIVVMMDDMRADEVRFLPATRALVRDRGLDFRNAFSPYPLCCPARASLLLGQYAHNHRVLHHEAPYGFGSLDDSRTIATALRAAGYRTGFVGKYLNGYGRQRSRVTGRSSVHYRPAGWTDWKAGLDNGWGGRGGTYSYFDFTQNVNGRVRRNSGVYSSKVIAGQAAGLVRKYHRSAAPFFLLVNPVAPHHGGPREADDPAAARARSGQLVRYSTPARPGWVKGRFNRALPWALGVRADGGPAEADLSDKPVPLRAMAEATALEERRMRAVERQRAESLYAWDHSFRQVIRALRETGELRDTLIVFTSDNGYFNGEHRVRHGKVLSHDPALRVPLLVAGPRVPRGVRYTPFTTVDLTATLLEVARAPQLPAMDSASRVPQLVGPEQGWAGAVVTEARVGLARLVGDFPAGLQTSGLRTPRYHLIRYSHGEGELYDLWSDPNQLTSLFHSPGHRELRDRLDGLWRQYSLCRGDECRVELPADLQMTPDQLAVLEARRLAAYQAYYR